MGDLSGLSSVGSFHSATSLLNGEDFLGSRSLRTRDRTNQTSIASHRPKFTVCEKTFDQSYIEEFKEMQPKLYKLTE